MQIPKQPRATPASEESSLTEEKQASIKTSEKSQSEESSEAALRNYQELDELLQEVNKSYVEAIQTANWSAQREYIQAVVQYLDTLQNEQKKWNRGSVPETLSSLFATAGQQDQLSIAEAYRKYLSASLDHQATAQKLIAEASASYTQSVRDIAEKLQSDIVKYNSSAANALKDALLRIDVQNSDIPSLALMYHGLRTMGPKSNSAS